jgi:hypothetical protein
VSHSSHCGTALNLELAEPQHRSHDRTGPCGYNLRTNGVEHAITRGHRHKVLQILVLIAWSLGCISHQPVCMIVCLCAVKPPNSNPDRRENLPIR